MTFNKKLSLLGRFYYQWLLQHVTRFFVVAEDDKKLLANALPTANITVLGDTRYDQCLFRLDQNTPIKLARDLLPKNVFVGASTWPEDEAVLLPYIKNHSIEAHWIIVPHEIDEHHIASIQKALHPIPTTLYSQIQTWNGDGVLIVDQFGVLAPLYKVADGAFIGGSFKARVHSVMESLACGNLTFVGPYHTTNREALEFKNHTNTQTPPVVVLPAAKDVDLILKYLHQWSKADAHQLRADFAKKTGASRRLVETLLP